MYPLGTVEERVAPTSGYEKSEAVCCFRKIWMSDDEGLRSRNILLQLFQPLHIDDSRNLADSGDDALKVLHVFDIDGDVDGGAAVPGAHVHVTDVGIVVADDRGHLLKHAGAVVADDRQLYWICRLRRTGNRRAGPCPSDSDAAIRLVHKIGNVRAGFRVYGDAFAAGDVAHDVLTANGIAAARAINQQLVVTLHLERSAVIAENSADHSADRAGLLFLL